ncbi:MAG: dihydrolipoyl dehydrogenase [Geminicoccaceae bacterium]|nr:MAG: dihydrolipoyl dehydrogenase [Geminicoccaceae bacterium]
MSEPLYDVVLIGGGPGGYVAAIKAAQLGMKVACVEKRGTLGGTCLNVGCIPSKALLHASHLYEEAKHGLGRFGIRTGEVSLDLGAMLDFKDKVVEGLTKGIEFLFKKNKVDHLVGTGRIAAPGKVMVQLADGSTRELATKNIVIATGSEPTPLPGVTIDEERIVSSTGALDLERVPGRLVVVGAGYIGLELGTVWRRLGAEVTVVEFLDRITPGMDLELSKELQKVLSRQGLRFRLATKVVGVEKAGEGVAVVVEPVAGGPPETLAADVVLVAIGRRPYTEGLGAAEVGVAVDERGRVKTDGHFRTTVPGIWAIGDVIEGPMLAHKAEEDGIHCIEWIAGQKPQHDYDRVPGVIYCHPEVAAVGKTEEQLKAEGRAYKVGKFPFTANSRARAVGAAEGFVKILTDAATDRILGCHLIGPDAGTMIAELALALEFGATAEDLARTSHPHPTLEEAVKEAALAAWAKPIHV